MVILGGLGSIWGTVLGAIALTFLNFWFLPDVINTLPQKLGLGANIDATQVTFAIYGFLLVFMMLLRPQGLLPERRRAMELTEAGETTDESVYTARV
jgi:branched-chain amino acid transport system permease protein